MKIGTGNELPGACFMWQASGKPQMIINNLIDLARIRIHYYFFVLFYGLET
jgi:hypothetical protein